MDFSGKSTIVNEIADKYPQKFIKQEKMISPQKANLWWQKVLAIKRTIDASVIWNAEQKREYWELVYKAVKYDIEHITPQNTNVVQDSVYMIKSLSKNIQKNEMGELLDDYKNLVPMLPEMQSVYLTTTPEERLKRLEARKGTGFKLSLTDALLQRDFDRFLDLNEIYKAQIQQRYPETIVVDTTNATPRETVTSILDRVI